MSHNREHALPPEFALPGHSVLSLQGVDAVMFAQAQFMNDVAALVDGQWHWNGWLTPKGRVIALFALLRLDAQTLWLLLPDVAATELVPLLQRYVFRSKLTVASLDRVVSARFHAPGLASGATSAVLGDGGIELDMGGQGGPRCVVIGAAPAEANEDAVSQWMRADLVHGLPRLPDSQREQWTPQQLTLERLRAFSVKKGCYPGQEIVARTHFLGQVKRGIALYQTEGSIAVGSEVMAGTDRVIGKIVSSAADVALAVVSLDAPTESQQAAGSVLHAAPLLDGLAR